MISGVRTKPSQHAVTTWDFSQHLSSRVTRTQISNELERFTDYVRDAVLSAAIEYPSRKADVAVLDEQKQAQSTRHFTHTDLWPVQR